MFDLLRFKLNVHGIGNKVKIRFEIIFVL